MVGRRRPFEAIVLLLLSFASLVFASSSANNPAYIQGTNSKGVTKQLLVSRDPALYTGEFADCLPGGSLFNITKFDAGYYADNMTVVFHLDGTSNIRKESIVMVFTVDAYGESRFNLTYDPCAANINSLCPLNSSVPVTAYALIPVSPPQVQGIPSIALGIPDLEGYARLQLFANSTETEIGCFQAVMTNGNSFSQPQSVGSFVGVMVFLGVMASFATAIYGLRVTAMRMHYAHSFAVLIMFETFQSMFYSGALSVNWPSVLPAWWSNFAWTAGMFAPTKMVDAINPFAGNHGNLSQVGGAGAATINNGGGLAQQIYGRSLLEGRSLKEGLSVTKDSVGHLLRRAASDSSNPDAYYWAGGPEPPGLPMPGSWPGFGGTLSSMGIPTADAFLIGLIWFLVLVVAVVVFIVMVKLLLDLFVRMKWYKSDGFDYFRSHLGGFIASAILRTCYIAFFSMMTLTMYQFSSKGPAGPTAIAVIVWALFVLGIGGTAAYACYIRLRDGKYATSRDDVRFESGKVFKHIPFIATTRASNIGEEETASKPRLFATMPFFNIKFKDNDPERLNVHQDEEYIKRFGWLSGRYRRSRWWFFAFYLGYQFIRACFLGGGYRSPLAQVYGLFVFELLALLAIIKINPFESSRNTTAAVWLLSISKIVTTGLSIAFLPEFNLNRIWATVLGIVIIVVQGFLAVAILVLIVLGMCSTWLSLSRNHEDFQPTLEPTRVRYFEHLQSKTGDLPRPKVPKKEKKAEEKAEATEPHFNIREVRRAPKIEDEDEDKIAEIEPLRTAQAQTPNPYRRSRANSAASRHSVSSLPRQARVHRASWSSKDFAQWDAEMNRPDPHRVSRTRSASLRRLAMAQQGAAVAESQARDRASMRASWTPEQSAGAEDVAASKEISSEKGPEVLNEEVESAVPAEEKMVSKEQADVSASAKTIDDTAEPVQHPETTSEEMKSEEVLPESEKETSS